MADHYEQTEEGLTLEEAFARIEALTQRMEAEDVSLEESFACYEEGMRLVRFCREAVSRVEQKVLQISEDGNIDDF